MPFPRFLPNHLRPRREKVFTDGRVPPLDRNAKARVMVLARALARRTEAGQHYGQVTAKALAVLHALLHGFHNNTDGRCFPSYASIAGAAACARSTVAEALKMLEAAGILSWVNRIVRIRVHERDLFDRPAWRWRVIRTSNAYSFRDPGALVAGNRPDSLGKASKSDLRSGTQIQDTSCLEIMHKPPPPNPESPLERALARLGTALRARQEATA